MRRGGVHTSASPGIVTRIRAHHTQISTGGGEEEPLTETATATVNHIAIVNHSDSAPRRQCAGPRGQSQCDRPVFWLEQLVKLTTARRLDVAGRPVGDTDQAHLPSPAARCRCQPQRHTLMMRSVAHNRQQAGRMGLTDRS
eukprot:COSAG01_NODE_7172_length_3313_cov_3.722360_3_plen_141_part_00